MSRDTESNHGGPEDDDNSDTDGRFSDVENKDNGHNVNNPNGFDVSSQSVGENTYGQNNDNPASSVTMNNFNNPTESSYSSQSAEENTNGHNNDSPSSSVVTTNDIQPQTCPTQRNHVRKIPLINLSSDSEDDDEDDEEDPICQMCWNIIESDKDMGYIDTQHKCECSDLQYHFFCLRRNRNECGNKNNPMQCGKHGNKIHRIMNMERVNIPEGEDICLICQDSLDTKSIWGRFVCGTCHHWYHYDCLVNYVNSKGSYHRDSCTTQYDMTRLKCV